MPLNTQIKAMMRRVTQQYFTDRCFIEELIDDNDDYTPAYWSQVYSNVKCRVIRERLPNAGNIGERQTITRESMIVLPHDVVVDVDYRITVNGSDVWQVTAITEDLTDAEGLRVIVKRWES